MRKENLIVPEIELPGIYGILNVTNGKMYIGSAINLKNRLKQQKINMHNWQGLNNLMSEDFKDNKDIYNFVFVILKVFHDLNNFNEIEMREEEKQYIDRYTMDDLSYNVHKETFSYKAVGTLNG